MLTRGTSCVFSNNINAGCRVRILALLGFYKKNTCPLSIGSTAKARTFSHLGAKKRCLLVMQQKGSSLIVVYCS